VTTLHRAFFARPAPDVASDLIGCVLVSHVGGSRVSGRIVETEAYGDDDPASHAYGGMTPRNASMFGPPGRAYVYRSYGVHWCFNVVTMPAGVGQAVLIRALEPIEGLSLMAQRRGRGAAHDLCSGPGKLCAALAISGALDGIALTGRVLGIVPPSHQCSASGQSVRAGVQVVCSPRIGISRGCDRFWRYTEPNSKYLSRLRV